MAPMPAPEAAPAAPERETNAPMAIGEEEVETGALILREETKDLGHVPLPVAAQGCGWHKRGLIGVVTIGILLAALGMLRPKAVCADTDSTLGLAANAPLNRSATVWRSTAIKKVMNQRSLAEAKKTLRKAIKGLTETEQDKLDKKRFEAKCALTITSTLVSSTRLGLSIDAIYEVCGRAKLVALAGRDSSSFDDLCLLNGLALGFTIARFGASLTGSVDVCMGARADRICAASIQAMMGTLIQSGLGGWVASETCAGKLWGFEERQVAPAPTDAVVLPEAPAGNPQDAQRLPASASRAAAARSLQQQNTSSPAGRRLFLGAGPDNFLASCVMDAFSVAHAVAFIGFLLYDIVNRVCVDTGPPEIPVFMELQKKAKTGQCVSSISFVVFRLAEIILQILLAIVHCSNSRDLKVLCAAGIDALANAVAGLVGTSAGIYTACDIGIKLEGKVEKFGLDSLVRRRLGGGGHQAVGAEVIQLATRYGFNSSDPTHPPVFKDTAEALGALDELEAIFKKGRPSGDESFERLHERVKNMSIDTSALKGQPPESPPDRELFVNLMESSMSPEAKRQVDALNPAKAATQLWSLPWSKDQCS